MLRKRTTVNVCADANNTVNTADRRDGNQQPNEFRIYLQRHLHKSQEASRRKNKNRRGVYIGVYIYRRCLDNTFAS